MKWNVYTGCSSGAVCVEIQKMEEEQEQEEEEAEEDEEKEEDEERECGGVGSKMAGEGGGGAEGERY